LAGKVDSLAEKRLAELAASGVRGVTSIENQLTVGLPSQRSDEQLRAEISGLIVHSVYLDNVEIDIEVKDATVLLSGVVHSAVQKDHLERVASVWGARAVDLSRVEIDPEDHDPSLRKKRYADLSDAEIRQAINRSLNADPILFSRTGDIEVDVDRGIARLHGTVNRLPIKRRAERFAANVVGVRGVDNDLQVEYPDGSPPDMEIIHETQEAFKRSPYLERHELRVHCQEAHVSLYGVVDSELEKQVAGWIAEGMQGVLHVNNALAVEQGETEKSDQQIKADLERKLKFALFDKSNDVRVEVSNGVAVLTGTVDTWRQWQTAMELALEAGAHNPHNMIDVRYHPPHGGSDVYVPE